MSITNTTRPTTTLANTTKVSFAETWATMTHSWSSETRTWAAVISLMTNSTKASPSMTNTAKPA